MAIVTESYEIIEPDRILGINVSFPISKSQWRQKLLGFDSHYVRDMCVCLTLASKMACKTHFSSGFDYIFPRISASLGQTKMYTHVLYHDHQHGQYSSIFLIVIIIIGEGSQPLSFL